MRSPKRSAPFSMGRPQPRHLARLLGAGSKRWGTGLKTPAEGPAELFERQFLRQLEVASARAGQTSTDASAHPSGNREIWLCVQACQSAPGGTGASLQLVSFKRA